jgi:hypothetical protein
MTPATTKDNQLILEAYSKNIPVRNAGMARWYCKAHSYARGEGWVSKSSYIFSNNENILIIAAVLVEMANHGIEDGLEDYKAYKLNNNAEENLFYYGDIVEIEPIYKSKTGIALGAEEWNAGIATSQREAEIMYDKSEPDGEASGEW